MNTSAGVRWRVTVHRQADGDMRRLKEERPDLFQDMMAALKALQQSANVYEIAFPYSLVTMREDGERCVRFKNRRNTWRCILRFVRDGIHIAPSADLRPGDNIYLQIVMVCERTGQTYKDVRFRVQNIMRGVA